MLQIENYIRYNVAKEVESESLVCPRKLRKGYTIYQSSSKYWSYTSSTSADGSFHGTGVSIMQALELDTERKHRTLPFEIILTDKNIEQSDNFVCH